MELFDIDMNRKKLSYYKKIPDAVKFNYDQVFKTNFIYNSLRIEGCNITLSDTERAIKNNNSNERKLLSEFTRAKNLSSAYDFAMDCIRSKKSLGEVVLYDINKILNGNTDSDLIYPDNIYNSIKDFFKRVNNYKNDFHPIELATYIHADFLMIRPFPEGNERTAKIILNYILVERGYRPILITTQDKTEYVASLDRYNSNGDISKLLELIKKKAEDELNKYKKLIEHQYKHHDKKFELYME